MNTHDTIPATGSPEFASAPVRAAKKQPAMPAYTFVTQDSDTRFAMILGRILAGMHGNPAYANPMPSLAEVGAAHDDFVAAIHRNDRGRLGIAARDKARQRAETLTRELALYVAQHCRGDLVTLLGSGFPARRLQGAARQIAPPTPGLLKLRQGPASGQIIGRCERVEGALLYQWRFASAQLPTAWTMTDAISNTRVTLTDLAPGTRYLVQARANGRRGSSDWSDAMAVYAV